MSRTYYKAVRPDLTDFYTGTIKYEVGATVTHPCAKRTRDDPSTYLSVATVATDCTGMRWPCRLLEVEGVGRRWKARDLLPNKRCFSSVRVIEERPAHEVFGPQGEEVAALIDRAGRLTEDEVGRLAATRNAATRDAAWNATWNAARDAAWNAARNAARDAAWYAARIAAWYAARNAARNAAWRDAAWRDAAWYASADAAAALLARDLISPEHFDALYGAWRSVTTYYA